jgi:hypothetical protein
MVAANKGRPSRKSFSQAFQAFRKFAEKHDNAYLYLHTMVNPGMSQGENIPALLEALDIPQSTGAGSRISTGCCSTRTRTGHGEDLLGDGRAAEPGDGRGLRDDGPRGAGVRDAGDRDGVQRDEGGLRGGLACEVGPVLDGPELVDGDPGRR